MKTPAHLTPPVAEVWTELVENFGIDRMGRGPECIVGPEFEAYCGVIARLRDAQQRISDEELIVPDSKAAPVAHPAYLIERQCADDLRKWGDKFRTKT